MSSTTLNPSEISELIKNRIEQFKLGAEARNEGTIISVSDGIVRIHGLADVMQGEMIELPGNAFALALNLERDSVGAVVLGEYQHLREGDTAKTTGRVLEVPVGPELLGRVVDALGNRFVQPDAFVEDVRVAHRFNRLLLYKANIIHSASAYGGLEDAASKRMTAVFFWMT